MNWLNQNWLSESELHDLDDLEMCGLWEKPDDAMDGAMTDGAMTMDNPCFEEDEDLPF